MIAPLDHTDVRAIARDIHTLSRQVHGLARALEGAFEAGFEAPSEGCISTLSKVCDHRRQHRPGRPAKLDSDPELRAFVLAQIDSLTFPQLEAEVANAFPAERQVRKTAINSWWRKHRATLTPKSQPE